MADRQNPAALQKKIDQLETELSLAHERIADLLHWRFGPKTERIDDPGQEVLADLLANMAGGQPAGPLIDPATLKTDRTGTSNKTVGKRKLLSEQFPHLPIDEEIIDLPEEKRVDDDGEPLVRMGTEVKEELVYDRATARINRVVRIQYGRSATGEKVAIASPPPCIVSKGMLANITVLQIIILHTVDCLPFNRIAEQIRRAGADVGRQLITSSFHAFCHLAKPLLEAMEADLLAAGILHVDGSFLYRQDRKRRRRCRRSPIYAVTDGRQVVFRWRPDEKHETAADLIRGYDGYLVRDEWDGWLKLDTGQVTHVGCNAHARRWFAKHQDDRDGATIVALYAQLYEVEHRANASGLTGDRLKAERLRLRQAESVAIMDAIHDHAVDMTTRRSGTALAGANYLINQRDTLGHF